MFKSLKGSAESFLLKAVRYGLFFAVFTPLVVFRTFWSPTNFGKAIVFRVLIEVITVLWIFLMMRNRTYRPRLDIIGWAFLFFVLSYILSGLISINPGRSFWGGFERMGGGFNLLHFFVFFLVATSVFKTKNDWLTALNLFVAAGLFSILYGFFQRSHWGFILGAFSAGARSRIFGTIGNPAMFGGYLLFTLFVSLLLLLENIDAGNSRKFKWFYSITAALSAVAIFMTAVRGVILALIISLAVFLFWRVLLDKEESSKKIKIIFAAALIILTVFLGLIATHRKIPLLYKTNIINRLSTISLEQSNIKQRLLVWKEALVGFKARPWLGWGPENFSIVHQKFYEPQTFFGPLGSLFDRPHNIFLEIVSNQGLIGFTTFVFLGITVATRLKKKYKEFSVAASLMFCLFLAYLIQGLFFFDSFSIYLSLSLALAVISSGLIFSRKTAVSALPMTPLLTTSHVDNSRRAMLIIHRFTRFRITRLVFTAIILISAGLLIYYASVIPTLANNLSAKAAVSFSQNNYGEGMRQWKKSLAYTLPASYANEIRFNVEPVFMDTLYNIGGSLPKETIKNDLDYLIGNFQEGLKTTPDLVEAYTGLDTLYVAYSSFVNSQKLDDSIAVLNRALELAPSRIDLWQELGNVQSIKGDRAGAIESLTRAFNLNRGYTAAEFMLAKAYLFAGQKEEGFRLGLDALRRDPGYLNPSDTLWLAGQFKQAGRTDDIIDLLELMSKRSPNYLIYLAVAYKDVGDIASSKKTADFMLHYEDGHAPGLVIDKNLYNTLAELYKSFGDIKQRTRALEKSGVLLPF